MGYDRKVATQSIILFALLFMELGVVAEFRFRWTSPPMPSREPLSSLAWLQNRYSKSRVALHLSWYCRVRKVQMKVRPLLTAREPRTIHLASHSALILYSPFEDNHFAIFTDSLRCSSPLDLLYDSYRKSWFSSTTVTCIAYYQDG